MRKKRARIYNNWHKGKKLEDYECPVCGWNALNDDEFKHQRVVVKTPVFHPDFFGLVEFEIEAVCPCCKTVFGYDDSNM